MTLAQFFAQTTFSGPQKPPVPRGNDPVAEQVASELADAILSRANQSARTLQKHIGPSEIGSECDREVAFKLAGYAPTNHIVDKWASIKGTAFHEWAAEEVPRHEPGRYLTEFPVTPIDGHRGTADGYDFKRRMVFDWKVLHDEHLELIRREGPDRKYHIQALLYALGFRKLGLPVDYVCIVVLPAQKGTLQNMFVHRIEITPQTDEEVRIVLEEELPRRQAYAGLLQLNLINLNQVPKTPTKNCYFCPAYRPTAERGIPSCQGGKQDAA